VGCENVPEAGVGRECSRNAILFTCIGGGKGGETDQSLDLKGNTERERIWAMRLNPREQGKSFHDNKAGDEARVRQEEGEEKTAG